MSASSTIAALPDAPAAPQPASLTIIQPRHRSGWTDLAGLWQYREMLWLLALRDIQVRYKQTALGALWAVIQPLGLMVVISVCLGRFTGVTDPVFLYAGLLPWTFFSSAVTSATNSLVANAPMLRKVYFPRLVVPVASIGAPLLDYALAFVVLAGLMVWKGVTPGWSVVLLPALILITIVAALGLGVLLASLTVRYRDFRYVVPFLIQVMFFATPVIYPIYRGWVLALNPMGGTLAALRAVVLNQPIDWHTLGCSSLIAAACLVVGLVYFQKTERLFADVV